MIFNFNIQLKAIFFKVLGVSILSFVGGRLMAQTAYPQNYFRNPLQIPIQLSTNFGEIRTNHFHMGLDIRTQQKENLPVVASAEGYVSRIKVEHYGYGRAIYINHPNGYTSVYAHLNDFYDTLHRFVLQKQYQEEKWEQDIYLEPHQFPVRKGQFIAYSGNTGGSAGPHLHFEIRETKTEKNINPELLGLAVQDVIPPMVYDLWVYNRTQSIYIKEPIKIALKKIGNNLYTTVPETIAIPFKAFSFGVRAEDKGNSSAFKYGIFKAVLSGEDGVLQRFELDAFPYTESRYINGSIDYNQFVNKKMGIQLLTQLPGNHASIFKGGNGRIELIENVAKKFEITLADLSGNTTTIRTTVQLSTPTEIAVIPTHQLKIIPNQAVQYNHSDIKIDFDDRAVYDTLYLNLQSIDQPGAISKLYQIHSADVPVHTNYSIQINPSRHLTFEQQEKVLMKMQSNQSTITQKPEWKNGWAMAQFNKFGLVQLIEDLDYPIVQPIGFKDGVTLNSSQREIKLKVTDASSDIHYFKALLDGKWLMFKRKDDYFIASLPNNLNDGLHELYVQVSDQVNNTYSQVYRFQKLSAVQTKPLKKVLKKKN